MDRTALKFNLVISKSNKPRFSHKDINVTSHAMLRAEERLQLTNKKELKKIASNARYKGVNISLIRKDTYMQFGLSYNEYVFIKGRFSQVNNSTNIYLYQGNLFIFCGKGNRTLKTVINLVRLI